MPPAESKHAPHFDKPVQSAVIGEHNTVTIQFQNGQQQTAPFLAPPRPPYRLIGRDQLLADLKQKLVAGQSLALSALNGLPGVGKTALAIELAYNQEVVAHFPDGILWAGLGLKPDVLALLGNWALALSFHADEIASRKTVKERQNLLKAAIGQKRMLIIVDDAWESDEALAFRVGGLNCAHLLTTRKPLIALDFAGDGVTTVQELSDEDGLFLLNQLASTAVAAEQETAAKLAKAVGNLPLALILMGRHLRKEGHTNQPRRINQALQRLQATGARLTLGQGNLPGHYPGLSTETPLSLAVAITISVESLDKRARRTLYALSVFPPKPNTFSEEAAVAISAEPVETLDKLTDSGLLEVSGPVRYALHQTIADYAGRQRRDEQYIERFVTFFVDFIERHAREYDLLELESNNLSTALDLAYAHNLDTIFVRGANNIYRFYESRGLYETAKHYLQQAEQIARETNDRVSLTSLLLNRGRLEHNVRRNYIQSDVYFSEGLILAREINDSEAISALLNGLGASATSQEKYEQAESYLQEGLTLAREIGHFERLSHLLLNLGAAASKQGKYKQAKSYLQEGLTLAREIGHRDRLSSLLNSLGVLMGNQGQYKQAEAYLQEGLTLGREIGDRDKLSFLLTNLVTIAGNQGKYKQVEAYLQEGLTLAREIGDHVRLCSLLNSLGTLRGNQGKCEQAVVYLQEGLTLARESGHLENLCFLLNNLGGIMMIQGKYDQAEAYLQEGLTLGREIGHRDKLSFLLTSLGELAIKQGKHEQAEAYLQEGLTLAREIGHRDKLSFLLTSLGELAIKQGNYEQAEVYLQEGLAVARGLNHHILISKCLQGWGELWYKQQQWGLAMTAFREALEIAQEKGSSQDQGIALFGLARVEGEKNNLSEAKQLGRQGLAVLEAIGHQEAAEVKAWLAKLNNEHHQE